MKFLCGLFFGVFSCFGAVFCFVFLTRQKEEINELKYLTSELELIKKAKKLEDSGIKIPPSIQEKLREIYQEEGEVDE